MLRVKPLGQPPKIWQVIEKKNKDGKLMKFTIQEIPEDRYEDAIQHMCTYFLADEPTCQCLNAKNDPLFMQDISTLWRLLLAEDISIAAFIDNPNGGKPIIAGMNVLGIEHKNQKKNLSDYQFKSEKFKITYKVLSITSMLYEHYEVDKYINALGLSVNPDYRGYGLGKELLKIRDFIGSTYGVPATATMFSSIISQKSAANAGFEEFFTKNFADVVDKDGKEYYPNINSKAFKIMGKRFI
ncbi:hypothetical protein ALC56_00793 [Trachymyrmex septentrionalis]|uniref:N-acetyltransferase domain-containing protein n=1 Tax=Trachymyrmex septentrionalis TaxID=34720 RepID=A0A195FWH4_9HYME|nr:PREDICTED: uncharacterized protein LOC108751064 [Trachymyrmex septentrionalis]KYN44798.1 hypothetical protein ALC56_00793 [Trachymyrmex septentrionalis]